MPLNNAAYSFAIAIRQANNQPFDLTGRALVMGFKNATGAAPAGATTIQTADNSIFVQSPAGAGLATATLSKTQMAAMAQGTWYWDLLDVTSPGAPLALGAGILPVRQGVTNSPTPVLPRPALFQIAPSLDQIQVYMPGDQILITLAPSGPPGNGATYTPQSAPPAPAIGFLVFCDAADGILKAIDSFGNITEIAP